METNPLNLWLEWIGTAFLIVGTAVNSMGYYPEGPLILCAGGFFWLAVSIRWQRLSLIVVNLVMTLTAISGLAWRYFS